MEFIQVFIAENNPILCNKYLYKMSVIVFPYSATMAIALF